MKKNVLIKDRLKRILLSNIIFYIVFYLLSYFLMPLLGSILPSNSPFNVECEVGFVNCLLSFFPFINVVSISAVLSLQLFQEKNNQTIKNTFRMIFTKLFFKLLIIHTFISLSLYYIVYGSILAIEAIFDMSLRC